MRTIMLAAMLAAMAAPAFADSVWKATPVSATPQSGVFAGDVQWDCDKSSCWSTSDTSIGDSQLACQTLARSQGPLSAFTGSHMFDAAALAKCNQAAKH
jgi:hypothetical protein